MRKSAGDYQVGWICALPLELAAAEGMLDEIHEPLQTPSHDQNQYTFGHIGPHNIVIACLPAGNTGIAAAAHVANHLHSSFTNIRFALLVGIGGGVPGQDYKVRLGDVIVSQPTGEFGGVVQYTFGKTEQGGVFRRTGFLNSPPAALMSAVSRLQAKHKRVDHEIAKNLEEMFERYPKMKSTFASPGVAADSLYKAEYDHPKGIPTCDNCDKTQRIPRPQRAENKIVIHYGNIASGDQVMRYGVTRDRLRDEFDVICFEMEAAGLMKNYPCLVIRGICDYADSHKNKFWQDHAAAVAAAYAKELLTIITPQDVGKTSLIAMEIGDREQQQQNEDPIQRQTMENFAIEKNCLKSLYFDELFSRQNDIKPAGDNTCTWLVEHSLFQQWVNTKSGVLWIKGNPGTGKSTLMKYILDHSKTQQATTGNDDHLIISYFFHGRGSYLQKGRLGLFRALLFQLVDQLLDQGLDCTHFLLEAFKKKCDSTGKQGRPGEPGKDWNWHPGELYSIFERLLLSLLNDRPLKMFVDALDECGEDEAIQLAEIFDSLIPKLQSTKFSIQICLSCRNYLNIGYHELEIYVEKGNSDDISTYVQNRLRKSRSQKNLIEIEQLIQGKAAGVFQWVCLILDRVTTMLRKGNSQKKIIQEIERVPAELEKLYRELLEEMEDDKKAESLKLMMWLCFSRRPLTLSELRYATAIDLDSSYTCLQELQDGDKYLDDDSAMKERITDLSCGLAETILHKNRNIARFISQSVRDFMITEGFRILHRSWETADMTIGNMHHRLTRSCILYLALFVDTKFVEDDRRKRLRFQSENEQVPAERQNKLPSVSGIPFLEYAASAWTSHAREADANGVPQDGLLKLLDWPSTTIMDSWLRIYNTNEPYREDPHEGMNFLHVAAANGLINTLEALFNNQEYQYSVDTNAKNNCGQTPLHFAALRGREAVVRLLLTRDDIEVNAKDKDGYTPLHRATIYEFEAVVRLLLTRDDIQVNAKDKDGQTPLHFAALRGREAVVRLLLTRDDIEVNAKDKDGYTPLHRATIYEFEAVVRLLLTRDDIQVNAKDKDGQTPLHFAALRGREAVVRLLLACDDIEANVKDEDGYSPLQYAAMNRHEDVVRLLRAHGFTASFKDKEAGMPLEYAVRHGEEAVVRPLGDYDDVVDSQNEHGRTQLPTAASRGNVGLTYGGQDFGAEAKRLQLQEEEAEKMKLELGQTNIVDEEKASYNNQGRLHEAQKNYERGLEGKGRMSDLDSASMLDTVNITWDLSQDQRKLDEEPLSSIQDSHDVGSRVSTPTTTLSSDEEDATLSAYGVAHNRRRLAESATLEVDRLTGSSQNPQIVHQTLKSRSKSWKSEIYWQSHHVFTTSDIQIGAVGATPEITINDSENSVVLLRCHAVSERLLANVVRLRSNAVGRISALVRQNDRECAVVLRGLDLDIIENVCVTMQTVFEKSDNSDGESSFILGSSSPLNTATRLQTTPFGALSMSLSSLFVEACEQLGFSPYLHDLLQNLHLAEFRENAVVSQDDLFSFWLYILEILDIVLLNHVGNHRRDFWEELGWKFDSVPIVPHWSSLLSTGNRPVLRQRPLSCLSRFLGYDNALVWEPEDCIFSDPYFVVCTIQEFSNVWGNVWGVQSNNSSALFKHFRTKKGYLLPWKRDSSARMDVRDGERFCHWVSEFTYLEWEHDNRASSDTSSSCSDRLSDDESSLSYQKVDWLFYDVNAQLFKGDEVLLIGADSIPSLITEPCHHSSSRLMEVFKGQRRLHRVKTAPFYIWPDFRQYTLQAGFHLTASIQGRIEIDPGRSTKEALVDDWALDKNLRDPHELEYRWGVVVSACTSNACRVRIRDLLRTTTMLNVIASCSWSSRERQAALVDAIFQEEPRSLVDLWYSNPDWQEEFGNVLLTCLRMLSESGIQKKRKGTVDSENFIALWKPFPNDHLYKVTIKASEHPWVRFLKDTESASAMVVLVEDALRLPRGFTHGKRHHSRDSRPSLLETAICLNRTKLKLEVEKVTCNPEVPHPDWRTGEGNWDYVWSVEKVQTCHQLWLPHGRLSVLRPIGRWYLLISWDNVARDTIRSFFGRNPPERDGHWEYLSVERSRYRPVPVHIQ